MRPLWTLLVALPLMAGCRSTAPPEPAVVAPPEATVLPPAGASTVETPDAPPPIALPTTVAPEADFLYEEREEDLRARFVDGLHGLYSPYVSPEAVRTVRGDDVEAWLDALAEVNPSAAQVAFDVLGPVLEQRFVTAFVAEDPSPPECARTTEVLYVAIPSRFQVAGRAMDGLLVRDACEVGFNEMCLTCTGDSVPAGTCSCTCAIAACPAVECAPCGER